MELEQYDHDARPSMADPCAEGRATLLDGDLTGPVGPDSTRRRDRGVIVQMNGLEAGRVFPLTDHVTLGRGRYCNIRFDDATLSRVHARIVRRGVEHFLEDAGSLNGCFVNDRRVQLARLGDGARVRLGSGASLRFQLVDDEEEQTLTRLYDSAVRDGLTGVLNRKQLEERLCAEMAYATRHGTDLSLVFFDIDHFKRINDTRGHLAGDAVLRRVAVLIGCALRAEDILARYGGEEFAVLARGISLSQAAVMAERLRALVEQAEMPFDGAPIRATMSCGVASLACCSANPTPNDLVALADAELYRAKAGGRNRVSVASAA